MYFAAGVEHSSFLHLYHIPQGLDACKDLVVLVKWIVGGHTVSILGHVREVYWEFAACCCLDVRWPLLI